ncbi:uncharacterized protein GGS22DRAFT_161267 [Annulohypoxylon maeteangense]|uniref:uncharacterized protein n=1 Tax=Annulohypoxylon maeteangense TaxID=1927788 RepID=UPI00200827A5|nr:uncharacterized protein GGS22DRAFT_161267 [Annulohypoxylon maeteangense]KAI0885577.1 hypothetical protein GGS22DRAFT_161267 [Annulohypoxylon maeteangense]
MRQSKGLTVICSVASLAVGGLAASEFQTCYRIDGAALEPIFRCDNHTTGHSSCCMPGEVCWSNGVCHGKTGGVDDWLRRGCTDYSWRSTACFDVCPWYVGVFGIGVRPCGGINESNQYCCDDGSTGDGSFACCNNDTKVFQYNNITTLPTIIATIPLNDKAPTSSSTVGSISTKSTSSQAASTSTSSSGSGSSGGSSNAVAIGVGLGVGLPAAAAIFAGVGFMIWRSRRSRPISEQSPQQDAPSYIEAPYSGTPKPPNIQGQPSVNNPQELPSGYDARELPAWIAD